MQLLRALLALWLVVSVGVAPAASAAALADPVCMQALADHGSGCGGGDALSGPCGFAGCAEPAVTEAPGASRERADAGRPTCHAPTPISSLALAPETAPPKHSIL